MNSDGKCYAPGCQNSVNWLRHDKPPAGWAHLIYDRYTKKGGKSSTTFLLCPEHTINFTTRQARLPTGNAKHKGTLVIAALHLNWNERDQYEYLSKAIEDSRSRGERTVVPSAFFSKGRQDILLEHEKNVEACAVYIDLEFDPTSQTLLRLVEDAQVPIERRRIKGWKKRW